MNLIVVVVLFCFRRTSIGSGKRGRPRRNSTATAAATATTAPPLDNNPLPADFDEPVQMAPRPQKRKSIGGTWSEAQVCAMTTFCCVLVVLLVFCQFFFVDCVGVLIFFFSLVDLCFGQCGNVQQYFLIDLFIDIVMFVKLTGFCCVNCLLCCVTLVLILFFF